MIGGVIVTHGQLANELVSAAEMIVGEIHDIIAVSIGWHDEVDIAREGVERAIQQVDSGAGVLLLTDMFGGTPTNIAASFLGQASVEVVTGVNLPMVIKVATQGKDETLGELARRVRDEGQQQIHLAGDILAPPKR
ncbi:MAG: PTS sugar transporter subunit IIA [Acidobacteriota bacterium]